jgi:pyridoxine 4-dehydrogenase
MDQTATPLPRTFALGGELSVDRLGYGAMRLTGQPGNYGRYPDWEGGKALLRRAVALGVTLIDTAHAYGPGWNEELIAEALHPYPAGLVIATKGGVAKHGPSDIRAEGRPEQLRAQVEESLRRLRLERIDLYQLHRPDPSVPWPDQVGALARLREEGKVRLIGLSNVDGAQLDQALALAPIASVQNRYNPVERGADALIDACAERGIAFLPHGPLGAHPMRQGAPLADEQRRALAERGGTPAQQALRWMLGRAPNLIAIPGTTSIRHLEENLGAWNLA